VFISVGVSLSKSAVFYRGLLFFLICFLLSARLASSQVSPELIVDGVPDHLKESFPIDPAWSVDVAAEQLVHFLENRGYVLAAVSIYQSRLVVDLGKITDVVIEGVNDKTKELVSAYLEPLRHKVPHVEDIDHTIGLINNIPGLTSKLTFDRIEGSNDYILNLSGSEIKQAGSLSILNIPTHDLSAGEVMFHEEVYSVFTGGDIVRFEGVLGEQSDTESKFAELSYQLPVNSDGRFVEVRLSEADSSSIYNFRSQTSIETKGKSFTFVLGQEFLRTVNKARTGYLQLDIRSDEDSLQPEEDHVAIRSSWFSLDETDFGDTLSYGVTLSVGERVSGTQEDYASLRGGFGYISWLPFIDPTAEFLFELSTQVGSQNQPVFELFGFNGIDKQRGFSPSKYAGSTGVSFSAEIANTVHINHFGMSGISPYLFVDGTWLSNKDNEVSTGRPKDTELFSAGLGSRFSFVNGISFNSWIGVPLHDGEVSNLSKTPEFYLQGQYAW
jgi:hemolysin activation/secretion protein